MKLFKFERPTIVRVDIIERGVEGKTFSLEEKDPEYVREQLKQMLNFNRAVTINPLTTKKLNSVLVQCYEHKGKSKGKTRSFTCYGMSVDEIYDLFMLSIEH